MTQRQEKPREPSKAEILARVAVLETELRREDRGQIVQSLTAITKMVIRYGTIALIGYFARDVLIEWTGETTSANLLFNIVTDIKFPVAALGATNVITFVLYRRERQLRQDNTKHMHRPVRAKELEIDPERSSSNLTERGTTNPKDSV